MFPLCGGCAVIMTYRCNAHCKMCHRHQHQSKPEEEISLDTLNKLPNMHFMNITGGEPFLRKDIKKIVKLAHKKAKRVVISTNGTLEDRILDVMRAYPSTGLRISVEGIRKTNDTIRGIQNGYQRAVDLLAKLKAIGCKDIGISTTISDSNYNDVIPLYEFCVKNGYEFTVGTVHNSFFFESTENKIIHTQEVIQTLRNLQYEMQHSHRIKDRYRSVFVGMLVLRAEGKPVAKCCHCGETFFALNPYGKILACLGSEKPRVMGNLKRDSFKSIWNSPKGRAEREACNLCNRNCCMSGNRAIDIKRDFARSTFKAFFAPSANSNAQGGTATF